MTIILFDVEDVYERYLRDSGGSIEADRDFSSTPTIFSAKHDQRQDCFIMLTELEFSIVTNTKMDVRYYGSIPGIPINTGLANGIQMYLRRASGERILIGDSEFPIRTNADLQIHSTGSGSVQADESASRNDEGIVAASFGYTGEQQGMILRPGATFELELNDDFSTLMQHRFMLKGQYIAREKVGPASAGSGYVL